MENNLSGITADIRNEIKMNRLSFKLGFNRYYCFGLGFEFYTLVDDWDEVLCHVLRLDFLLFSINLSLWKSKWRKAEWL